MRRKLITLMIMTIVVSFVLIGYGGSGGKVNSYAGEKEEHFVLKLGHVLNEDSPFHKGAEELARSVKEKTSGRLEVKIFPNAQLGNDRTLFEAMQVGTVDMEVAGSATIVGFAPRLQVFDMPFIFRDHQHAYKVLDGSIGREIMKDFEKSRVVCLAFWENGFRHLTNSVRPVKVPGDVKGLKIRVQEIPLHIAFWKLVGTNPTPMAWTEVYTALQQKTVDGQENPIQTIYTQKIYEVQRYLSLTNHVYGPAVIMVSKATYDKLPADLQKVLMETAQEVASWQRNYIKDLEDRALKELPSLGMEVEYNPDREAFKACVQPIYDEYGEKLNVKDIIEEILNTK